MKEKPTYEELEKRVHELEIIESEHKYSKEALRENESLFKRLYEKSPLGYQSLDENGHFIVVNQTWLDTLGYNREEVLGKPFADFLHPDWRDHFTEYFPRFKSIGEILGVEFEMVKKNGNLILVSFTGMISRDERGNFQQTHCIFHDITERKQAEDELKSNYALLQIAGETAKFGGWSVDLGKNICTWSDAVADIHDVPHGYSPPVQVAINFYAPKWREKVTQCFSACVKEGSSYDEEMEIITQKGKHVWVRATGKAVKNDNDEIIKVQGSFQDITEKKQAEEALRENEEKFRALFEKGPIGVAFHKMVYDDSGKAIDYRFLDANSSYLELTGVDPRGKCVTEAFPGIENDPFDWIGTFGRVAKTGEEIRFEQYLHPNKRWYDCVGYQVKPDCFVAAFVNITERKQAEQRLQRQTVLFQNLFKNSPDAIAVLDHEDRVLEINRSFETLFGYSYTEAQGQEINDLLAPEPYRSDAQSVSEKVIGDVQVVNKEGIRCTKGGRPVDVSLIGYPLVVDQQKIGAYAIYRDITERKRAEEALVRQQRSIQLNNRIANVFLTSTQDEVFADVLDVVLKALNSRFGYFGYIDEAGDLISPSLTRDVWGQCQVSDKSIVFPRSSWGGLWGRSLLEKQTLIANKNLQVPEGHVALDSALATPIIYNNNLVGQFVVANKAGGYDEDDRDLLESVAAQTAPILFAIQEEARREIMQEKLESQLRQAQKMESVGRLAGGVAHDFNNMLGVILGHTEMALDDVDPVAPLHASLQAVQQAAERSAALTRQLLAFARKQTIAPKVIDINDTVEGMLNMIRRLIGENINLLWQPGHSLQPVKVDPSQLDQLLANLCVNARDAIAGVGKITIKTDAKTFDEDYCADHLGFLPGEYVLLEVSDDGCGMDKKTLNQIFEPFFTTKEQGQGTGLGLASVFGMVKQNNGFINVYSEPGQGSIFKIYLPAYAIQSDGVKEKAPDLPSKRGNETILLVEDESAILEMTTKMLDRLGYTVVAAATPGEAIRLAHEYRGRIDLLMTDVVMPEMNGRQLAANLLSHNPDLKRLFMSGYTANVIAHHGVLDEGVHFIQKPFAMKDLGGKLREALEA